MSIALGIAVGASTADAQTVQPDVPFDEDSVGIYCNVPKLEDRIPVEVFNVAFGEIVSRLQLDANEGRIHRAYYLGGLRQGIFVIVAGDTPKMAMGRAEELNAANIETIRRVADEQDATLGVDLDEVCQLLPIGPLAIQPIE